MGLIGTKAISGLPSPWRDLANKHIGTSSYPLIVVPIVVLVCDSPDVRNSSICVNHGPAESFPSRTRRRTSSARSGCMAR